MVTLFAKQLMAFGPWRSFLLLSALLSIMINKFNDTQNGMLFNGMGILVRPYQFGFRPIRIVILRLFRNQVTAV